MTRDITTHRSTGRGAIITEKDKEEEALLWKRSANREGGAARYLTLLWEDCIIIT